MLLLCTERISSALAYALTELREAFNVYNFRAVYYILSRIEATQRSPMLIANKPQTHPRRALATNPPPPSLLSIRLAHHSPPTIHRPPPTQAAHLYKPPGVGRWLYLLVRIWRSCQKARFNCNYKLNQPQARQSNCVTDLIFSCTSQHYF